MRDGGTARGERGTTLAEIMLVLAVLGVAAAMAWPQFGLAGEQARVDLAAAELRSLWVGERLHWLETGEFTSSLQELRDARFLDAAVGAASAPFTIEVLEADAGTFAAEAQREGTTWWSGQLLLDEGGEITGFIASDGGQHVSPSNP